MADNLDIDNLAQRMLRGELGRVTQAELDAVLSWVSGSEKLGAAELIRHVGVPRERPDVMRQIYAQLDGMLFFEDELDRRRAGVQPGVDDKLRRARYRRLMTAFHPDRHPDSAEWLTPRSQAVLEAYSKFRSGNEGRSEPEAPEPRPRPSRKSRRAARDKAAGRGWPVERSSARLTPERAGLLTRMRIRLRGIDNLQGKVLATLAVVALVPVVWVYFSYKPYRDRLAPQPRPEPITAESSTHQPPEIVTLHPPQPDAVVADTSASARENEPADSQPEVDAALAMAATEQALAGDSLPGEIDTRSGSAQLDETPDRNRAEPAGDDTFGGTAPLLDLTAKAARILLTWEMPEGPTPSDTPNAGESATPTAVGDDRQLADTTPDRNAPSASPTRNPEPATPNPTQKPQAEATPDSNEPTESPTRNPEPGTPNPKDSPQAHATPDSTEPTESPTRNPEPGTPKPKDSPQADTTSATTQPPESQPRIQARVQNLLDNWSLQFGAGRIEGIMALLADNPRENRNRGRDWFRDNYGRVLRESQRRRLDINVLDVRERRWGWLVTAQFDLNVTYPDDDPVRLSQEVDYRIVENNDGDLRIQAIEY